MTGQRAQPGLDGVDLLADAGEAQTVDDPLDQPDLLVGQRAVGVGDGDGGGQVAEGDMVAAQGLEREIGVGELVVGVAVGQGDRLVADHLAQDLDDGFALVEP